MSAPLKPETGEDVEVRLVPAESPGYALWLANLAWQRAVRDGLKPHDLTHMQFALLAGAWWLNEAGHESTQRRIAAYMGVDEQMVGQVAKRLETAGLVRRERAKRDARALEVIVTTAGLKVFSAASDDMIRIDEEFFGELGDDQERSSAAYGRSRARPTASRRPPAPFNPGLQPFSHPGFAGSLDW